MEARPDVFKSRQPNGVFGYLGRRSQLTRHVGRGSHESAGRMRASTATVDRQSGKDVRARGNTTRHHLVERRVEGEVDLTPEVRSLTVSADRARVPGGTVLRSTTTCSAPLTATAPPITAETLSTCPRKGAPPSVDGVPTLISDASHPQPCVRRRSWRGCALRPLPHVAARQAPARRSASNQHRASPHCLD